MAKKKPPPKKEPSRTERIAEWLEGREPVDLEIWEIEAMRMESLICGYRRPNANYAPCMKPPIKGRERCRVHRGAVPRGPDHWNYKHGRYAEAFKGDLRKKFLEQFADDDPLNILPELYAQRTLFVEYVSRFEPNMKLSRRDIYDMMFWAEKIVKTATAIVKVRNETALTTAEIVYLKAAIIGLLEEFIPDPARRKAFILRLDEIIPSGSGDGDLGRGRAPSLPS